MAKSYGLDCPVANTLDIIGERWTLMLMRDLFLQGAMRYRDFQNSFPDISPNTLADRLKMLEANGIIRRQEYESKPPREHYILTDRGKSLGPILAAIRKWGRENPP